jgi:hypothetical protein
MRYLKSFENMSDNFSEIKDIFLDYIDKYNIEELPDDLEEFDESKPVIYYHFSDFSNLAEMYRRSNGVLRRC